MSTINIQEVLAKLAEKRPIFHSEADFQHSLAWQIKEIYRKAEVRLEVRSPLIIDEIEKDGYIDLVIIHESHKIFIEVKYKVKNFKITVPLNNTFESFDLKSHGAHTDNRKHFYHDIKRLEFLLSVDNYKNAEAYAIFLSNDYLYENPYTNQLNIYKETFPISLNQTLEWHEYSSFGTEKSENFKYLLVPIKRKDII